MLSLSPRSDSSGLRPQPPELSSVVEAAVPVLRWGIFAGLGLDAVVTTGRAAVSAGVHASLNLSFMVGDDPAAVLVNRRRAAAAIGAELGDLTFAQQVHGPGLAVVGRAERARIAVGRGTRSRASTR